MRLRALQFKIIVALDAAHFGAWEAAAFAPEKAIVSQLEAVKGVKHVETQTCWCCAPPRRAHDDDCAHLLYFGAPLPHPRA